MPLRLPRFQRLAFHPGGKAFIQPDVIPPLHGDQVAEPLVRHLVRYHGANFLIGKVGSVLFVDQQQSAPEGNSGGILHRSRGKVG